MGSSTRQTSSSMCSSFDVLPRYIGKSRTTVQTNQSLIALAVAFQSFTWPR
uniref:Uncharacterized protein n=1 Tax=Arundo donax TaxID=35708 RepID=A0A0A8ZVK0_ARUDO